MKIAIVGLGYVGLPLALAFAEKGVEVVGIDTDPSKVILLNRGESYIRHIDPARIAAAVKGGLFRATASFAEAKAVEAVVI